MPFWGKNRHSSGADNYRQVESLIRNGREIYIVSPYIDAYYAALIRRYAHRKRFYILSSSMDRKARAILESRSPWAGVVVFVVAAALALAVLQALSLLSWIIVLLAIMAIALRIAVFRLFGRNRIRLKVPKGFVHAKMYVSEKVAISGSANLTYKGMHSNIEHMEMIYDPRTILDFKKQFWKMWDS